MKKSFKRFLTLERDAQILHTEYGRQLDILKFRGYPFECLLWYHAIEVPKGTKMVVTLKDASPTEKFVVGWRLLK